VGEIFRTCSDRL